MTLPNSGLCSYNGVAFTSMYKSKVEVQPVRDSAGRALVVREYTIEVEGRVAGNPTDMTLAAMRIALEKPAGALQYTGKGFGPLNVNMPGGVYDAAYGPWPEVLSWTPIGNDQGCVARWKCKTVLPCEERGQSSGIIEYCWSEAWDIDEHGATTRSIDGHVTIQATRAAVDARAILDNADAYRELIVPDLPDGFQRTQNFKLSEDKRTLEFQIKDEEMAQPLLPGTTGCEVEHRAKWTVPKAGSTQFLSSTINGSIAVPIRSPRSYAWNKIMLILRSRWPVGSGVALFPGGVAGGVGGAIQALAAGSAGNAAGKPPRSGPGATFLLKELEIGDQVFGNSVRFSASCVIIPLDKRVGPSLLLTSTGLWAPIPGSDFLRWKQSIFGPKGKPYSPRGVSGLKFENSDDAIVDLCANASLGKINSKVPGKSQTLSGTLPRMANGSIILPGCSWLRYRLKLSLSEDDRIIRHKPLATTSTLQAIEALDGFLTDDYRDSPGLQPPEDNEIGGAISAAAGPAGYIETMGPGYEGGLSDVFQQVSTPTQTLTLSGDALRLGYPIATPRIVSIGTTAVVQIRQKVSQQQVSEIAGVPIYAASFRVEYAPAAPLPAELPMPVNPAQL